MSQVEEKEGVNARRNGMTRTLPRLSGVGGNGVKMLLVSNGVLLATLGLSGLLALLRVVSVALRTPAQPSPRSHLLVLGVKLKRGGLREDYRRRLERAAALQQQGAGETIVLLGGKTSRHCASEAATGRQYLLQQGVAAEAIVLEERSRHTLENLRNTRELLGGGLDTIIITNRYHLARTGALARGLSMPHVLCAAEERLAVSPTLLLKLLLEAYYLHWYYSGAVWARLVRDHASLARIR